MKAKDSDIIYTSLIGTLESAQRAGLIIVDWSVSRDVIEVKQDNPDQWKYYKQGPITNLTVKFMDPTKTKK